ncbi:MAG: 3D-(3,5/4)-trihydroxycyclohexane-1,2-dione acylhydrolase (decyclizing) [Nakamurella sp.]
MTATPAAAATERLTVAQAIVKFLGVQYSERDGERQRLITSVFGIFGHGNIAGLGQALWQDEQVQPGVLPYRQCRNEQSMVHTAVAYARTRRRTQLMACTTSVGPGATNLVTGAALATVNRLPVLLLPGDVFATRASGTVLQQLESPRGHDISVNDCLRPVSVFFDRVWRAEQLPSILLGAMRALTDPADTGAVTIALPQDVQAEAHDWPVELFAARTWQLDRRPPEHRSIAAAAQAIRAARRPLLVAGGGVHHSAAEDALRAFADATGIPVAETQAGKGSLPYDHPRALGALGATGTTAANSVAAAADLVIGVGTRWSDFTTASQTVFAADDVAFVNINTCVPDAHKLSGLALTADAREALLALSVALQGFSVDAALSGEDRALAADWDATVAAAYAVADPSAPLGQSQVIGLVNELTGPADVVVCAAGSMPGDLHKMWRTRDSLGYHVEYGFSCMGYEIAGGLGVKMAEPDRQVVVMVGDGSYLMLSTEIVTAVQEGIKLVIVLVQNHGYASIGALSETVGAPRFGTNYRFRDQTTGTLSGGTLPVDLAGNAASLGADVLRATTAAEFGPALQRALASDRTTVVYVECGLQTGSPSSEAWWDVPVAETSTRPETGTARDDYDHARLAQRQFVAPFTDAHLIDDRPDTAPS